MEQKEPKIEIDQSQKKYVLEELWGNGRAHKQFLLDLLDHVVSLPDEWKEDRIFLDGEFDSNRTEFENLSNLLQIGAKATSTVKGYMALLFLRLHIDKNPNIVDKLYDEFGDNERAESEITLSAAVEALKDQEASYTSIFAPGEKIEVEMIGYKKETGAYNFTRVQDADKIDLWDLARLRTTFAGKSIADLTGS